MIILNLHRVASPLGQLLVVIDSDNRVRALEFESHKARLLRRLSDQYGDFDLVDNEPSAAEAAILAKVSKYFVGDLAALDDIQVMTQGTEFQERVWTALRKIPAGEVTTYGRLANDLGYTDGRMARTVGAAIGANPVCAIVACHRVVGADGSLTGYSGGLDRKEWLLKHEKVALPIGKKRGVLASAPAR